MVTHTHIETREMANVEASEENRFELIFKQIKKIEIRANFVERTHHFEISLQLYKLEILPFKLKQTLDFFGGRLSEFLSKPFRILSIL